MSKNTTPKKVNKTSVALVIAGLTATVGFAVASAVSLGVSANNELAAGTSVTASCQPAGLGNDIVVGFDTPVYVPATQGFTVDSVELSNVDAACNGLAVQVVVADATGASLGSFTGTVGGATVSAALPASVDSETVASVSVVIYDN